MIPKKLQYIHSHNDTHCFLSLVSDLVSSAWKAGYEYVYFVRGHLARWMPALVWLFPFLPFLSSLCHSILIRASPVSQGSQAFYFDHALYFF